MKKLLFTLSLAFSAILLDATIKIQTSDDQEIEYNGTKEQTLLRCGTIHNMVTDVGEDETIIVLPKISKRTLENIISCLEHFACDANESKQKIHNILSTYEKQDLIYFIEATSFLDIPELLEPCCKTWSEIYGIDTFKNGPNSSDPFNNREILKKLSEIRLPALLSFFINKYLHMNSAVESKTFKDHKASVNSLAYHPHKPQLASGSMDNTIRIWDTITGNVTLILQEDNDVLDICFNQTGTLLASCFADGGIRVFNTSTWQSIQKITNHSDRVFSIVFNPQDPHILASGSADKTIGIWNATTAKCYKKISQLFLNQVHCVRFHPEGNIVASSESDGKIHIWDVHAGNCLLTINIGSTVFAIRFSPDGTKLISSSGYMLQQNYNPIKVWDVQTGQCLQTINGHKSNIQCLHFTPCGNIIVSGSYSGLIRLWDTVSEKCIQLLTGHYHKVNQLAFNSDGTEVASCATDHTIRIWDIAGPLKELQNNSYLQLLFFALCQEAIENDAILDITNSEFLQNIFETLPLAQQKFLEDVMQEKLKQKI